MRYNDEIRYLEINNYNKLEKVANLKYLGVNIIGEKRLRLLAANKCYFALYLFSS